MTVSRTEKWPAALQQYRTSGFDAVRGWVAPGVLDSLACLAAIQQELGSKGSIGEIGVYEGRFFLALDALRNPGERSFAFDIFDDQHLNVDKSGSGASLMAFRSNIDKFSRDPSAILSKKVDSLNLSFHDILSASDGVRYRLFSVDGGHTVEHTIHDLIIASSIISNDGVVILDDYYNPNWPGVHEGFVRYMMHHNTRLVPFAYHANKLFLCSLSYHNIFLDKYSLFMGSEMGYTVKSVSMCGKSVNVLS